MNAVFITGIFSLVNRLGLFMVVNIIFSDAEVDFHAAREAFPDAHRIFARPDGPTAAAAKLIHRCIYFICHVKPYKRFRQIPLECWI